MDALLPDKLAYRDIIKQWLKDDVPSFDIGGYVVGNDEAEATLLGKSPGVVAGIPFANMVFEIMHLKVDWKVSDGFIITKEMAAAKFAVAIVRGPIRDLLVAERTALNILSRASGVATLSKKMVDITRERGWKGQVAATRKTTPGFGFVEKYACLIGGASTHRINLSHAVMLKDNHIWATGNDITKAVEKAKVAAGFTSIIEVECQTFEEACEAAKAGAHVVMLDNYKGDRLKEEATRIKKIFPNVIIEASGGIDETSIHSYISSDVDVVSVGKLTQGYPCLDFSLKVKPMKKPSKL